MSIQSRQQLENTRKKLSLLEARCRTLEAEPRDAVSDFADEIALRSLKKMINQMKEEITRFESRTSVGMEQT